MEGLNSLLVSQGLKKWMDESNEAAQFVSTFWSDAAAVFSSFWRQDSDEDTRKAMVKAALESVPEDLRTVAAVSFCPEISSEQILSIYSNPDTLLSLFNTNVASAVSSSDAVPALSDESMWQGFDPTQRQRARQLMLVCRRGIIMSLLSGVALIFLNTVEEAANQ